MYQVCFNILGLESLELKSEETLTFKKQSLDLKPS